MDVTFLGGAGTVTGSRFLVEAGTARILVDCGLFQGLKQLRQRNWQPLGVDPAALDAVVLSHAHIDHSGYLPALVGAGFSGPVYASPGTRALCEILLPDAGFLQEEEARYARERGFSKHRPPRPLYTAAEAEASLAQLRTVEIGRPWRIGELELSLSPVGHILGATAVHLRHGRHSAVFSGDVGRPGAVLMQPPAPIERPELLVLESTYGARRHGAQDPAEQLAAVVRTTAERGGVVLVPAFAVGRAQELIYLLYTARRDGRMPELPVFLDSPMATNATALYDRFTSELRVEPAELARALAQVTYVRNAADSKALNRREGPMVIISASGMASGGRVLHHLARRLPDERSAVVFAGFQAAGTRGDALVHGADEVKIHGAYVRVRARVEQMDSLSAHADYAELVEWLRPLGEAPDQIRLVHGEPAALDAMRRHLHDFLGWDAGIAQDGERVSVPRRAR